jgi:CheY-like chemotaxis protein/two-component sensor histidine kinase
MPLFNRPLSDQRRDEFLAKLAHELRNPLAPLSNALELWPLVENDRSQMEQLRLLMERQILQLKRLADDLLDITRIARGQIELQRQPIELQSIISGVIEAVQPAIAAANHEVTLQLSKDPIVVEADAARLAQVFVNILQNAVKYTGTGGKFRITAQQQDRRAVVTISDNGPGIPEHMLTRIFELFQQGDQTLKQPHGGLGIGLTLVKWLVELHSGKVEAHSAGPGQGSQFVVELPISTARQTVESGQGDDQRPRRLPSLRILVVDDVQASANTLSLMLESIGQHVSTINDGRQVSDWVKAHNPDIVFLDIAMPGMTGYDVARQIRSDPEFQNLSLVALTGYDHEDDRRKTFEAGFNYHVVKPTSIEALEQLLVAVRDQLPQTTSF